MTRAALRARAEAVLVEETGAASVVRQCGRCGSSDHGRPILVGSALHVSMGYADDLAIVAWGAEPVGIDIERADGPAPVGTDIIGWTRIEALGKAAGTGVTDWPRSQPPDRPTRRLDVRDAYVATLAGRAQGWRLISLPSA